MKTIYLDYASLTPIDKGVLKVMKKYSSDKYTNPSALYASAVRAQKALEEARERVARVLHAHPDEILFTSGGTESNQLVLNKFEDSQAIISAIEHSSIIKNTDAIRVPVDSQGLVDLDFLKKSVTPEINLVSIILVNNEIGTIQSMHEISKIVRDASKTQGRKIFLHIDACQAVCHLPLDVGKLGVDYMTLDGGKMYGPRGIGMLYVKRGSVEVSRAGTENTPAIMGFVYALELAEKLKYKETIRIAQFKKFFVDELKKINKDIKVNGSLDSSIPNILNVSIPGIDSEFFVLQLDAKGIECSTKSACLRDEDESYVLKAIGADSKNSVRFSLGRGTTKRQLRKVLMVIMGILVK